MGSVGWSVLGLVFALVGVLMLFRYGMPFRVRTEGVTYLITEGVDEAEKAVDRRYTMLGYVGLLLVIVGTLFQMYGSFFSGVVSENS